MATSNVSTMQFVASSYRAPAPGVAGANLSSLSLVRIPRTQFLGSHPVRNTNIVHVQSLASKRQLVVYAEYSGRRSGGGAGDFFAGFLLGGVLFGAIGYLIAPTVNKSIAGAETEPQDEEVEDPPKKLPKYSEDDEGLETTRQSLSEKIAQLNAAIDDVSAQLRADEEFGTINESAVEIESAA